MRLSPFAQLALVVAKTRRNRGGRGVAVAVDVDHALVLRDAHAARRGVDDAQVGLVGNQETDVVALEVVTLHHLHRDVGHLRNGGLEYGVTVPHDRMPVVLHRLDRSREARTARLHVELHLARAVGAQDRIHDSETFSIGFQQHGGGGVAEERTGRTVGIVDDRRHLVGAHDDDLLARAGLDELRTGGQGEQEAAASCRNVEREGVLAARLVGDQVTRRGEEHVGGHRGADHHVDLHGVDPCLIQQIDDRAGAHVGTADAFALEDMPRFDTRMRHDPLVVGVDHPA